MADRAAWLHGKFLAEAIRRRPTSVNDPMAGITPDQLPFVVSALNRLFPGLDSRRQNQNRRSILNFVYGVESAKQLKKTQASRLIDWATIGGAGEDKYDPSPSAIQDAADLLAAFLEERGQGRLL